MATTWFEQGIEQGIEKGIEQGIEKGIEQGIEKGIEKGQRALLTAQIEERFGPLTPQVCKRLDQWPADQLPELARRLVRAQSLEELGLAAPDQ